MHNDFLEVSFYRLTSLSTLKAVPKLVERIYYSKQNLVIIASDEEKMKDIDNGLWSYSTKHFLPHGTHLDDHKTNQPIYITNKSDNPNKANITMAVGIIETELPKTDKIIHIFDGNDSTELAYARKQWKSYKSKNIPIIYWQQKSDGSWEKQ